MRETKNIWSLKLKRPDAILRQKMLFIDQMLFIDKRYSTFSNIQYVYTVRDPFSFCKEINDQDSTLFMASFDIQSLFTNIPLDEKLTSVWIERFRIKRK